MKQTIAKHSAFIPRIAASIQAILKRSQLRAAGVQNELVALDMSQDCDAVVDTHSSSEDSRITGVGSHLFHMIQKHNFRSRAVLKLKPLTRTAESIQANEIDHSMLLESDKDSRADNLLSSVEEHLFSGGLDESITKDISQDRDE